MKVREVKLGYVIYFWGQSTNFKNIVIQMVRKLLSCNFQVVMPVPEFSLRLVSHFK